MTPLPNQYGAKTRLFLLVLIQYKEGQFLVGAQDIHAFMVILQVN